MAEIHAKKIKEHKLDTVLAEDITFSGELSFTRELMIKGRVRRHDKGGRRSLYRRRCRCHRRDRRPIHSCPRGKIRGNVQAESQVELMGNAEVIGDITAPKIIMETGCRFEGVSRMVPAEEYNEN